MSRSLLGTLAAAAATCLLSTFSLSAQERLETGPGGLVAQEQSFATLKSFTPVLGVEALKALSPETNEHPDYARALRGARNMALIEDLKAGGTDLPVYTPEFNTVSPNRLALPITIFGRPILYSKSAEMERLMIGATPARMPTEAQSQLIESIGPFLLERKAQQVWLKGGLPKDADKFIWRGERVDDLPSGLKGNPPARLGLSPAGGALDHWTVGDTGNGGPNGCQGEFCFLPTVALHRGEETLCSGSLISFQWVLTAGHCLCDSGISHVTIGNQVDGLNIAGSKTKLLTISRGEKVIFFGGDGFCEAYRKKGSDVYTMGDLALLELRNTGSVGAVDPRVAIATQELLLQARVVDVVGFGQRETDRYGGKKFVATIGVKSATCSPEDSRIFKCVEGQELVGLDTVGLRDSCNGDSGGSVYVRTADRRLGLVALVSRAVGDGCGPGGIYPLVTTRRIQEWLKQNVSDVRFLEAGLTVDPTQSSITVGKAN